MKNYIVLLITVLSAAVNVSCKSSAKKEVHLLPDSFIGKAVIFFDDSTGTSPDSNGYRIYEFSDSAILRTNVPPNDGFLLNDGRSFFYKKSNGKVSIPIMLEYDSSLVARHPNKVYVFNLKVGRYNKSPYFSYCIDSLKNAISYYEEGVKSKGGDW